VRQTATALRPKSSVGRSSGGGQTGAMSCREGVRVVCLGRKSTAMKGSERGKCGSAERWWGSGSNIAMWRKEGRGVQWRGGDGGGLDQTLPRGGRRGGGQWSSTDSNAVWRRRAAVSGAIGDGMHEGKGVRRMGRDEGGCWAIMGRSGWA
jgi:hypothetical protein